MSQVQEYILDNGLTVLLKEVHSAPVVAWVVAYRIGSRNERTGVTGVSHWVEHMMFKGTPTYPAGELDKAISRIGAQWNAFTSMDWTAYYETLPADNVDLAMHLEADRMVNATFDVEEVESERTVIISERHGYENYPWFWLRQEMRAAAFQVHGYHHEVLGDLADLETMTRDDLYGHYHTFYMPNNAVAIAVGDFDSAEMLAKIKEYYGSLPRGPEVKPFLRPEPEPNGERRVRVERPGTTALVSVGWRAPGATDPDWLPLTLADSVLTGPGGEVGNKTSRLYKALVETELAAGVGGGVYDSIDPYLYSISVTVRDGQTPEACEAALLAEIDRLVADGITQAELDKAKKQARAIYAYAQERVTEQAFGLAQGFILGDWRLDETYLERLDAVTLEQVNDAARRVLTSRSRVVGTFVPLAMDDQDGFDGEEEADDGDA